MGQYHRCVSMNANEYLDCHYLGVGAKEWEQMGGAYLSAFAFLIAHNPGNMPADVGHHPMAGRWAGHRILNVGDYAERGDIKRFQGPPLNRLYGLCSDAPEMDTYAPRVYYKQGRSSSSDRWRLDPAHGKITRVVETPEIRFKEAMKWHNKRTANGKYELFANASRKLRGVIEYVNSVRFCGTGWAEDVPVDRNAVRGADGHLHYRIAKHIATNQNDWELTLRMCGLGGWRESPHLDPRAELMPNGERWPWDRPPADLSWHNAGDADQDVGQTRVFANLDTREYVDPAVFGEVPTTLGIMRATDWRNGAMASSTAAVFAMLYHPERRGGGDITPEQYILKGRWRNHHLALTSEYSTNHATLILPTTDEVRASYTDISKTVMTCAAEAVRQDEERAA